LLEINYYKTIFYVEVLFTKQIDKEDEKIEDSENLKTDISSPSYQYGIGCFTTTRTINRKIFELENHLKRLESNLKEIQNYGFLKEIKLEKSKIVEFLSKEKFIFPKIQNSANTQKNTQSEYKIKIMLNSDGVFIYINEFKIDSRKINEGIVCKTLRLKRNFPVIKSTSYQDSIFALQMANGDKKLKCDEMIFEDDFGNLLEAHFSNILWIKNGQLFRSPKGTVLEGITQKIITKLYPQIKESYLKKEHLKNQKIEAAFLTKSTTLIEPIKEINGIKLNPKHQIIEELKAKINLEN